MQWTPLSAASGAFTQQEFCREERKQNFSKAAEYRQLWISIFEDASFNYSWTYEIKIHFSQLIGKCECPDTYWDKEKGPKLMFFNCLLNISNYVTADFLISRLHKKPPVQINTVNIQTKCKNVILNDLNVNYVTTFLRDLKWRIEIFVHLMHTILCYKLWVTNLPTFIFKNTLRIIYTGIYLPRS